MPRKVLDTSKLNRLGWEPTIDLEDGITTTYAWFREQIAADLTVRGA